MPSEAAGEKSPTYLSQLGQAIGDIGDLLKLDVMLLRAEVNANVRHLARAAMLAFVSLTMIAIALAFVAVTAYQGLLAARMAPLHASAILALGSLALATLSGAFAFWQFGQFSVAPHRAIAQLRTNFASIKAGFTDAHAPRK